MMESLPFLLQLSVILEVNPQLHLTDLWRLDHWTEVQLEDWKSAE